MPTLPEHVAIAGLAALPFSKKPKWVVALCWTAIIPDFDIFLGMHRMVLHSLIVLLPIIAALIGTTWRWFPGYREPALFVSFCLLSHVILDWFGYYVALLWPVVPLCFWFNVQARLIFTGPILIPYIEVGPMVAPLDVLFQPADASFITLHGLTLLLFFTAAAMFKMETQVKEALRHITDYMKGLWKNRPGREPGTPQQ